MNVKAKMLYHAQEYRRLKSLLVGDAGGIATVEKVERTASAQLNELKRYYGYVESAKRELDGTVQWLYDLATKHSDPEVRKVAKASYASIKKNYDFIKKKG